MSNDVLNAALKDFKRSVEITRDARFQANLRLVRRQTASSYMISLLSLYVIGLSLLPNILDLQSYQNQILLACSIVLSVFVIFTSLIDGSQNFYHQGELLHRCARKLATVHQNLKGIDVEGDATAAAARLKDLQAAYREALDDCPINHENVDFYRQVVHKPQLFPNAYPWRWQLPHRSWYRARNVVLTHAWAVMHLTAVLIVTVLVVKYVIVGSAFVSAPAKPQRPTRMVPIVESAGSDLRAAVPGPGVEPGRGTRDRRHSL